MTIGRMIVINSVLTLLMLGTPQAANIPVAGATNFPMPGKGIAALFREKNRHNTILSFGASGEPFGQNNKPCHSAVSFRRPLSPEQTWRELASRSNPASSIHMQARAVEIEC